MSDLIERDRVLNLLKIFKCRFQGGKGTPNALRYYTGKLIEKIDEMPVAEPEVIRCKDCRFAHLTHDETCKYCDIWIDEFGIPVEMYLDGDFYCGHAERRTDE